jgi:ribulose bisphosphate carboxylase small subunit
MDFFKDFFKWNNIPTGIYVIVIIVLIIMHSFIFYSDKFLPVDIHNAFYKNINTCVALCEDKNSCNNINNLRGSNYWIGTNFKDQYRCKVSTWEISHMLTHVFLGYFTNIFISQGLSVGFEIYEQQVYNCGSWLDLVYNFSGYLIGYSLKYLTSKKKV